MRQAVIGGVVPLLFGAMGRLALSQGRGEGQGRFRLSRLATRHLPPRQATAWQAFVSPSARGEVAEAR